MTTHLSDEQLNLLKNRELRGSDFVMVLHHLEVCEDCRNKMPKRSVPEVFHTILGKESGPEQAKQKPAFIPLFGRSLAPLAFGVLLLLLGSAMFFVFKNKPVGTQTQANLTQPEDSVIPTNAIVAEETAQPNQNSVNLFKPKVLAQKPNSNSAQVKQVLRVIPQSIKRVANKNEISKQVLTQIVQNPRVSFVWRKIKDAVNYEITIFDKTYNEIARQTIKTNSFQMNDLLKNGNSYFWKLTAYNAYGEVISTQNSLNVGAFQIAEVKKPQQVKRLEKTNQDNLEVLDFMIAKGMLKEAKRKLEKLSAKNPKDNRFKELTKKVDDLIKK